jgi:hypothetical protein
MTSDMYGTDPRIDHHWIALSGLGRGTTRNPGRCPGLAWSAPLGLGHRIRKMEVSHLGTQPMPKSTISQILAPKPGLFPCLEPLNLEH